MFCGVLLNNFNGRFIWMINILDKEWLINSNGDGLYLNKSGKSGAVQAGVKEDYYKEFKSGVARYIERGDKGKWSLVSSEMVELINELDFINKDNIKVLDVSGAPGIVAMEVLNNIKNSSVSVTDYSDEILLYINNTLNGVSGYYYDFDNLSGSGIEGVYDVILLRNVIYYSSDLDRLLSDLYKHLSCDGVIYVKTPLPTISSIVKYSLTENMPPKNLWSPFDVDSKMNALNLTKINSSTSYHTSIIGTFISKRSGFGYRFNFIKIIISIFYVFRFSFKVKKYSSFKIGSYSSCYRKL
jgi:hypothetical protein